MQIGAFGPIVVNLVLGLGPLMLIGRALAATARVFGIQEIDPAFAAIAVVWLING